MNHRLKVLQDVFPAIIALGPANLVEDITILNSQPLTEGAYLVTKARIIVTDERIVIAVDDSDGPKIVFNQPYDPALYVKSISKTTNTYVTTMSGQQLAFKKDENCGCGSRLRSWNPYNVVYSSQDPTE